MRTARLLLLGTTFLALLLGCGSDDPMGPDGPTPPSNPTPDPDLTAPAVSLTLPAPESEVHGSIALHADASDNVAVTGVQFLVDGQPHGAELRIPPYVMTFDTRSVADGPHTVSARARDAAGLTAVTQPIGIVVYNEPGILEVTIMAPAEFHDADGFQLYVGTTPMSDVSGTGTVTLTDVPAGTRRLSLRGLPPFCGGDEPTVTVRSDAPASAVLTIGCMGDAASGWLLISRVAEGKSRLSALSVRTGKETVLVPRLDGFGAVSPDGTRLAFTDAGTLMVGDLDGFTPSAVASVPGALEVSWSPDGSALVVASGEGYVRDLVIVNADGTDLHPLFDAPGFRRRPVWSATGRIAFEAVGGGPWGDVTAILAVDPDGGNLSQVTPGAYDESPAWSPDGSRLAFTRWYATSTQTETDVAVVNADGTSIQSVRAQTGIGSPVWAPGGAWIVSSVLGALQATHVSGSPTVSVAGLSARALGWVAGDRFD